MRTASPQAVAEAAAALAAGRLVAFPTETVYGLGADALNARAVSRIFAAKGRPAAHPLIVHVPSLEAARALSSDWTDAAEQLAQAFWPGPLTLVVRRASLVPDAVTGGQDTVALRWPRQPTAQALLKAFAEVGSGAVAAPSANRFGGVSPSLAQHVEQSLGPWLHAGDLILDDGACEVGIESTIVDCTVNPPRILRPGGISREALGARVRLASPASPADGVAASRPPRVSGSLESHYAPVTPLRLLSREAIEAEVDRTLAGSSRTKLLCWVRQLLPTHDPRVTSVPMPRDAEAFARQLYARLHAWDAEGYDLLLIEAPPATPEWEAVRDRLSRAASADAASHTP